MDNFEKAIKRLNKICDACNELEKMAQRDLDIIKEEHQQAKETIKSLELLDRSSEFAGRKDMQERISIIANGKRMLSCMGVGIEA